MFLGLKLLMSSDLLGDPSAMRSYLDPREVRPSMDLRSAENLGIRPGPLELLCELEEPSSVPGGRERS